MSYSIPKPFILYSYLATEMLAPFFASFVIMNAVFFLVKLIPFLNFSLELSIGFSDFIRLLCYTFPNMFLYTIPMASMMGVTIGFSRLSNDTEILALKASGISMYQILPPVLIISIFISAFTAYFSVQLIPVSETAMNQLTYQLLKEKIDKGIKEYQFTEALGDLVVHVGKIDKETGAWQRVWVSDMRGVTTPTITMASRGKMVSDIDKMNVTIVLYDGSLHRANQKDTQIVQFKEYTINIPLRPPTESVTGVHRGTYSMKQLQDAAEEFGYDTVRGRVMLIEYHKRLVLPIGCLFLTLLGLPLGLQAGPGRKAIGIPLGLTIFITYYIFFTVFKMFARDYNFPVGPAMWLPNVLFLTLTLFFIRQVTNEQPLIPEKLHEYLSRFSTIVIAPFKILLNHVIKMYTKLRPVQAAAPDLASTQAMKNKMIHGAPKSKLFHFPECELYDDPGCTIEFKNAEIAFQSGYKPCLFCTSLLDDATRTTFFKHIGMPHDSAHKS